MWSFADYNDRSFLLMFLWNLWCTWRMAKYTKGWKKGGNNQVANQKDQNETKINDNFCRITIDDHSVGKFVYRYTTSSFTQSRTTILIYSKNGGRSIFETKMMKTLNTKDVLPAYRTSQYFQQHRKQTSYDNHDVRFFCIFLKDLGTKKNTLTIDYNKG